MSDGCNLVEVFNEILDSLLTKDSQRLDVISNEMLNAACTYSDKRFVYIAIFSFALSKILEKREFWTKRTFERFLDKLIGKVKLMKELSSENKKDSVFKVLKESFDLISKFDRHFSKYVIEILDFAKSQKGRKLYEKGFSLSTVADFIGVSKWDLIKKVGEIRIEPSELDPKKRLKTAEKIFGD